MNILFAEFCAGAGGYLIGAIPTAYLLLQLTHSKDIRQEGSGNVGAMNTYEVSGKKWLGILVAVLDILKGALAVWVGILISREQFIVPALAAFFAVTGHNYSIFLKMHGGRGLATATGAMLMINPVPIVIFLVMWLTGYFIIRRNIHVANVVGVLGAVILMFNAPELLLRTFTFIPLQDITQLRFLIFLIGLQIAIRHIQPLRNMVEKPTEKNED